MKFYATPPSRARLQEDVNAFVSLLKFERDEQAEKMVLSTATLPPSRALYEALGKAKLTQALADPGFEGEWRTHLEDPADPYGPEAAKEVRFLGTGEAIATLWWKRAPTSIIGRFKVVPKGAGFSLGFSGFEADSALAAKLPPKAPAKPAGGLFDDGKAAAKPSARADKGGKREGGKPPPRKR